MKISKPRNYLMQGSLFKRIVIDVNYNVSIFLHICRNKNFQAYKIATASIPLHPVNESLVSINIFS